MNKIKNKYKKINKNNQKMNKLIKRNLRNFLKVMRK